MNKSYLKPFIKYTLFNSAGMIALSCYILADTFFISKGLGPDGLTALNIAIPIFSFISGISLMLGMGGSIKYTINRAQNKQAEANRVFTQTIFFSILFAVLFVLIGIFGSKYLSHILGADDSIIKMTDIYIKVILLFSPAFIFNQVLICFVRNDNNPGISMIAMIVGSLSNILFDYIFIFPLKMGIFGAVIATGFSPIISMIILSSVFLKHKNNFRLIKTRWNSKLSFIIIKLGIPSLITELSSGIVIIVFNLLILKISGNIGIAAYGVIANISIVVVSIFSGISQGVQPLISKAHGTGDIKAIKKLLIYSVYELITFCLIIYGAIIIFNSEIVNIFNSYNNKELQMIAEIGMILYFTSILFSGFNIISSVFFVSLERPFPSHVISLLRGFIIVIPISIIMSTIAGMNGIWLSIPISEFIICLGYAVPITFKMLKSPSNN